MDYKKAIDRVQKLIDSRPKEVSEADKVDENYLKLQLGATISFIKHCQKENDYLLSKISNLSHTVKNANWFLGNFGFGVIGSGFGAAYTHKSLTPCSCGHRAQLQYVPEEKMWCVLCPKCFLMTGNYPKIKDAVKAWINKDFTETSLMLNEPLTVQTVDNEGLMELARRVCQVTADDYVEGGPLTRESLKTFFRSSPLMLGTDGDAVINKLDKIIEEKKAKQEEKERANHESGNDKHKVGVA